MGTEKKARAKTDEAGIDRMLAALRVAPGSRPDLSRGAEPDPAAPGPADKKAGRAALRRETDHLQERQARLYADGRHALLAVFQAMDTAGKDGVIRGVFGPLNPQGVRVASFKRPTPAEQAHDFLWRVHAATPGLGMIGVFNRSHYEDVLVARVHKLAPADEIARRYDRINEFERLLADHRVTVVKFMLHITKDEQRERLRARLDDPAKHWKFDPGDLVERKRWGDYMDAYARALERCSTAAAPWYVIPANRKWYRDWAVARILRTTLDALPLKYPKPDFDPHKIAID